MSGNTSGRSVPLLCPSNSSQDFNSRELEPHLVHLLFGVQRRKIERIKQKYKEKEDKGRKIGKKENTLMVKIDSDRL